MGAYQIFKIVFKSKESRDWFENELKGIQKPRRLFQYNHLKDYGELECCYYIGFDGYGIGQVVLKQLKKAKQMKNIIKFTSIDLTCEGSWWDEIKEEESE